MCDAIDADPAIGAVIVTGEGGYFCAGAIGTSSASAGEDPAEPATYAAMSTIYNAFARVGPLEPPTLAAIRGGALGAGLNLAMATDLRIVADDAVLLSGFLPIGLHPGGGHSLLLAAPAAGRPQTAWLCSAGRLTGAEAVQRGLAWKAVPSDEVDTVARESPPCPPPTPKLPAGLPCRCAGSRGRRQSRGTRRWTWSARRRCGRCAARRSPTEARRGTSPGRPASSTVPMIAVSAKGRIPRSLLLASASGWR